MTVQLYIADIRPLAAHEAALLPLLSQERRQQAEAFRDQEGRLHCIAAGLLLRRVLAVGAQPLGVDIQPILRQLHTFPVKKVFHADEQQWLATDPSPERLTLLWTRLESALKASGTGFDCPERQYSLVGGDYPYHFETLHYEDSIITVAAETSFTVEAHILPPEALLPQIQ